MKRGYSNDSIRELDLELELLKRKRQVLQEKRQMMEEERAFDRLTHVHSPWATDDTLQPFEQSSYGSNYGFGSSKGFQNQYHNRGGRSGNRGGGRGSGRAGGRGSGRGVPPSTRGSGLKRPASTETSYVPPGKRFAGPSRGNTVKNPTFRTPKPATNRPQPRSVAQPNVHSTDLDSARREVSADGIFFSSNEPPSNQLSGRLELLLGYILKQVRFKCQEPPYKKKVFSTNALTDVKELIRERIRNSLINKKVTGKTFLNLEHYRSMYPIETDQDLINILVERKKYQSHVDDPSKVQEKKAVEKQQITRTSAEPFKNFVRNRLNTVVKTKLADVFAKLKQIYDNELKTSDEETKKDESEPNQSNETLSAEELEFEKKLEPLIRNKLYALLPQFKDQFKAMLDIPRAINEIVKRYRTEELMSLQNMTGDQASQENGSSEKAPGTGAPHPHRFMTRVIGHPNLPQKEVMKEFLNRFNPTFIKKYRQGHNVLFVELQDKKSYTELLEANGTMIDKIRIIVKQYLPRSNNKEKLNNSQDISFEDETVKSTKEEKSEPAAMDTSQEADKKDLKVEVKTQDEETAGEKNKNVLAGEDQTIVLEDEGEDVEKTEVKETSEEKESAGDEDKDSNIIVLSDDHNTCIVLDDDEDKLLNDVPGSNKDHEMNKDGQQVELVEDEQKKEAKDDEAAKNDNANDEGINKDVSNKSVLADGDTKADEEWNTEGNDEWADLKVKNPNNEKESEISPTITTRRSTRLMSDKK